MCEVLKHCLARLMAAAGAMNVLLALASPPVQPQTYIVLHSFSGAPDDGIRPYNVSLLGCLGTVFKMASESLNGQAPKEDER